jgi:hypothetical protein
MNLAIGNPNRFPHIYALDKLGGDKSADGEKYYEEHEKELEMEFTEIMKNVLDRDNLGDNNKIHKGCSNRR